MRLYSSLFLGFLALISPGYAQINLNFSGNATVTFSETEEFASYKLPVGAFVNGQISTVVAEGPLVKKSWRINVANSTTLGVMDRLRQQIEADGFELLYECETRECGGFDFRFGTEVLPEPVMHIDLGDFRYLAAQRLGEAVPEYLSLFVSRSSDFSYIQMILVGSDDQEAVTATSDNTDLAVVPTQNFGSLINRLEAEGAVVLDDLDFGTGSSDLGEGSFQSLRDLADYLKANANRQVALVGHTDAVGSLAGNIDLSRKRARSVARRLVTDYGVPEVQVASDGVGYLAPRASNLTEKGRTKNRRVEVVLTSTQ